MVVEDFCIRKDSTAVCQNCELPRVAYYSIRSVDKPKLSSDRKLSYSRISIDVDEQRP